MYKAQASRASRIGLFFPKHWHKFRSKLRKHAMGCTSSVPEPGKRKKVVILGGGYAGTTIAKKLDRMFDVIIVDRRNFFHHKVGNLRASTNAQFAPLVLIPYDRVLKDGVVLQAEVTSLSEASVQIMGAGERAISLPFDYLVIATGAAWSFPASPIANDAREAIKELESCGKDLERAKKVLIVGGGAVGVEMAAEIKHYHPKASIVLVHRGVQLGAPALSEKFYASLTAKLERLGITVVLNEQARSSPPPTRKQTETEHQDTVSALSPFQQSPTRVCCPPLALQVELPKELEGRLYYTGEPIQVLRACPQLASRRPPAGQTSDASAARGIECMWEDLPHAGRSAQPKLVSTAAAHPAK